MQLSKGFSKLFSTTSSTTVKSANVSEVLGWNDVFGGDAKAISEAKAMKVSAFYRAIDLRANTLAKLPVQVRNMNTREEVTDHHLSRLLWERPNEAMTPFMYKNILERQRLIRGNGYAYIYRDAFGRPLELLPLPVGSCSPYREPTTGMVWYLTYNPKTGEPLTLHYLDVLHYKNDPAGIEGRSLLHCASQTLKLGALREEYEQAVYENGGNPAITLSTDTDLSRIQDIKLPDDTTISAKELMRREWERIHNGANNAFRVAILDNGLKVNSVSMSNKDVQFVENKAITVADIARFTGVPLHKLFAGDQSYNSNSSNSLDFVVDDIQPVVTQLEEEDSFKLLTTSDRAKGLWLPRNMMAALRGDVSSRGEWYRTMHDIGAFSVNDILALEDMPDVEGGDIHQASLNYVPLSQFERLSISRNEGDNQNG